MMPSAPSYNRYPVLIASVIFFVPLCFLACRAEWQYDEAWTYLGIMHSSYKEIAEYTQFKLANNHVLNSLYFHWLQGLGIKAEIMYRLLSLLAYIVYSWFIYKLLKQEGYEQRNWSFLVLFLLPYIGFFAMGRGYAPAIACFTVALYFYKAFRKSKATKQLLYFILSGSLATLSLFSFLFPFMAMILLLLPASFKELIKPRNIAVLFIALPVTLYVFVMGKVVNTYDLYIIGGDSLFRNGALSSMISYLCLSDMVGHTLFLVFKISLLVTLIPALIILVKRRLLYTEHMIALVSVVLMLASHYIFAAKYPMFRGLMYMIILLYLPFVYSNSRSNILITVHLVVVGLLGAYNIDLLINKSLKHRSCDALAYMAGSHATLFVDNLNPNMNLYNHLYFNDSIKLLQYEMEEPEVSKSFFKALDTAVYVVCTPGEMQTKGADRLFSRVYSFPDNDLFIRKK